MKTAKQLIDILEQSKKQGTTPYDTQADVVRVDGDTLWCHFLGGIDETPVEKTINADIGDTVQVRVSGGRAWVTGNQTAPPTDDKEVKRVERKVETSVAEIQAVTNNLQEQIDNLDISGDENQYFWHVESGSDTGSHITEIPKDAFQSNPRGFNILIRSIGFAIRNALTELAQFTSSLIRLGQSNDTHIDITTNGIDVSDGIDSIANFGTITRIGKEDSIYTVIDNDSFSVNELRDGETEPRKYVSIGAGGLQFRPPSSGHEWETKIIFTDSELDGDDFPVVLSYIRAENDGSIQIVTDESNSYNRFEFLANGDLSIPSCLIISQNKRVLMGAGSYIELANGSKLVSNEGVIAFGPGEVFTTGNIQCAGYITNASKSLEFFVPLPKSLTSSLSPPIKTVTISNDRITARGVNGYVGGSQYLSISELELVTTPRNTGVTLRFNNTSAFTNVTNNTPVTVLINVTLTMANPVG